MKSICRVLSLLICFELILCSIQIKFLNPSESFAQVDCSAFPGTHLNPQSGRCEVTKEDAETRRDSLKCDEQESEADRRKCLTENAERRTREDLVKKQTDECNALENPEKQNCLDRIDRNEHTPLTQGREENIAAFAAMATGNDSGNGAVIGGLSAAAVAVPLIFLAGAAFNGKAKLTECRPWSLMLLYAGAVVMIGAEVYSYIAYLSAVDNFKKRMEAITRSGTTDVDAQRAETLEAQSESFLIMADNEQALADVALHKAIAFGVSAGLFATGAFVAGAEAVMLALAQAHPGPDAVATIDFLTCNDETKKDEKKKEKEIKDQENADAEAEKANKEEAERVKKEQKELNKAEAESAKHANDSSGIVEEDNVDHGEAGEVLPDNDGGEIEGKTETKEPPKETKSGNVNRYHLQKIFVSKFKKSILKNMSESTDMYQLMSMYQELKNIEFENYSRVSYLNDEDVVSSLKNNKIPLDIAKLLTNIFFASSYAQTPPADTPPPTPTETETPSQVEVPPPKAEGPGDSPEAFMKSVGDVAVKAGDGLRQLVGLKETLETIKGSVQGAEKVEEETGNIFSDITLQPLARLAGNTLLGTWTGVMTPFLYEQHVRSQARATVLRDMKAQFDGGTSVTGCTPEQRNSPASPNCFCLTPEFKINPARSNSQVCQDLFSPSRGGNFKPLAGGSSNQKTCIDKNSGADPRCECKKKRGRDGKNNCFKVSQAPGNFNLDPGLFKVINAASAPANDLLNGNIAPSQVNTAAIANNAARLRAATKKLQSKNPKLFVNSNKLKDKFEKKLLTASKGASLSSPGSSGGNLANLTPAQALSELKKELENKNFAPKSQGGASSGPFNPSSSAPKEQLEFGMSADDLAVQEVEVAKAMKDKLDYGQNDISNSSSSIFEMLSNRYQRSGMKRLFDEGKK